MTEISIVVLKKKEDIYTFVEDSEGLLETIGDMISVKEEEDYYINFLLKKDIEVFERRNIQFMTNEGLFLFVPEHLLNDINILK